MSLAKLVADAEKLGRVSLHILRHYASLLRGPGPRARDFFTEVYLSERFKARGLPTLSPADFFRGAPSTLEVRLYDRATNFFTSTLRAPDRLMLHSKFQASVLAALAATVKPRMLFEFGTAGGITTYNLLRNAHPEALAHTLDLVSEITDENVLSLIASKRIIRHLGNSRHFDFTSHYGKFDFVFVDGGHGHEMVSSDSENALRLLGETGLVVWDDYSPDFKGVVRYLESLAKRLPLQHLEGTSLVLYRKGAWRKEPAR